MPLSIEIGEKMILDEETNSIYTVGGGTIELEFSLRVIFDWEAIHQKPLLNVVEFTKEEAIDLVRLSIIDPDIRAIWEDWWFTQSIFNEYESYRSNPQSATTVSGNTPPTKRQIITAEVLYAQMIHLRIPKEYENWNFHRLTLLLNVIAEDHKPSDKKRRSDKDVYAEQNRLNRQRREALKTNG